MPKTHMGLSSKKLIFLVWTILCISVFMFYPGKFSWIYGSTFDNWQYLLSKLGRINFVNYIFDFLKAFVGVTLFSLISVAVGSFLLKTLQTKLGNKVPITTNWWVILGTVFLIGQGLLSIIFLLLGIFHQLTTNNVILVLIVSMILGFLPLSNIISRQSFRGKFRFFVGLDSKNDKVLIWFVCSILFLSLMYSASRLSYDSASFYFSNAKITAVKNQIEYFYTLQNESFIISSLQTGIQYAAIIKIFGDQAARMYSWINGVIIIIFSLALGREVGFSKKANLLLLVLILTSTSFLDLLGDGKIELVCTAPAIAAIYWMVISSRKPLANTFLLTGFLAGLAMVDRPYNIFLLTVFIGLFYLHFTYYHQEAKRKRLRESLIRPFFWVGIGIICLLAYHLIASWIIIGDPLSTFRNYQIVNPSNWYWNNNSNQLLAYRVLYPIAITYLNTPQSLGNITPLFISFLPLILHVNLRKNIIMSQKLISLAISASVTLLVWVILFFTVLEIRYVLFLWIILFMPLARIIENALVRLDPFYQKNIKILMVILLLFITIRIIYISLDSYSPIDKHGNPHCYDDFCTFMEPVNKIASPGDRVLTLNAYRYYLRSDLFACSTMHDEYLILQNMFHRDSMAFWTEVYRQGYKFITYENNFSVHHLSMDFVPDPKNTPVWLELKLLDGGPQDGVASYRIITHNAPVSQEKVCVKTSGIWEVEKIH